LSRASEAMRSHNVGALAIAAEGRVIGLIRDEDLLEPLSQDPEGSRLLRVGEFASADPVTVPASAAPQQALRALQWSGSPALPVVEENGAYRGMLSRGDLMAFWSGGIKPPRIGGMATPFGVYLTGSGIRGGVGDLSLMSTGACFGVFLSLIAFGQSSGLAFVEKATGWPLTALALSPPTGMLTWMDGVSIVCRLLPALLLLFIIRLTPLAGFHAGEHQTVWAIERDEPLVPEAVGRMPRPHPRCGTNLVVGLLIFEALRDTSPYLALIAAVLFWRRLGYFVQLHLTTRPATRKQLESGIKAGKELLERYRENLGVAQPESLARRVWNLGLLQVFIGCGIASTILFYLLGIPISLY
jgi:CBS domain-containing protein